jgi:hypothetical protein
LPIGARIVTLRAAMSAPRSITRWTVDCRRPGRTRTIAISTMAVLALATSAGECSAQLSQWPGYYSCPEGVEPRLCHEEFMRRHAEEHQKLLQHLRSIEFERFR